MKSLSESNRQRLLIAILLLASAVCIGALWNLASTTELGKSDFTAYWSAAYLVHNGQNPYDQPSLMEVEHSLAHTNADIIAAWNPPTLFVFLLPLAWLSFAVAKAAWLVANVIILLLIALILTRLYLPTQRRAIIAFCLFVVLFPQALLAIAMGQVTFLVVLGLVSSMVLIRHEQWFWAGFVLILTTIKPHVAVLAVPYLLLYFAYRRRWQAWLGLFCAGILCMIVLFVFRPSWITDFAGIMHIAPVNWATPTIGGMVSFLHVTDVLRYLFVVFLPLTWFLARPQNKMSVETSIALLTILTIPTTFYGWSFDQTILIIPIAQIFGWLAGSARITTRIIGVATILIITLLTWIHRVATTIDVYYFWIPLAWAAVYGAYFVAHQTAAEPRASQESLRVEDALSAYPNS